MPKDVNIVELMAEMDVSAAGIERASNRLYELTRTFDGFNEKGELGVRLVWEALVEEEATRIYDEYEEKGQRPPPEPIRRQRAMRYAKDTHPEMYVRYHQMKTELEALMKWLSSYRAAIDARRSILSAEKELFKGIPQGPQPQWSDDQ